MPLKQESFNQLLNNGFIFLSLSLKKKARILRRQKNNSKCKFSTNISFVDIVIKFVK